jgi:hypothetical protein
MLVISPCTTVSCNWIRLILNHFTLNMLMPNWILNMIEGCEVNLSGSGQGPMADSWTQWWNSPSVQGTASSQTVLWPQLQLWCC